MSKKKIEMTIDVDNEGIRKLIDATLSNVKDGKEKRLEVRAEVLYEVVKEFFMSKRQKSVYRETLLAQLICLLITYIETGDKGMLRAFYEMRENMLYCETSEDDEDGSADESEEDYDDDDK